MKRLDKLIKKIISSTALGSTALFTTTNSNLMDGKESVNVMPKAEQDSHSEEAWQPSLKPKLILRQASNSDSWLLVSHRSHRSHSSHRSHYSSRTSPPRSKKKPTVTPSVPKVDINQLGSRTLKQAMTGNDVLELEKLLIDIGYHLKPDNNFDNFSTIVIKDFQIKNGLSADGIVKPITVFKLKEAPKSIKKTNAILGSRVLKKGMSGEDILELRKLLIKVGYTYVKEDRVFDDHLELNVRIFQDKNKLQVDGVVGPLTIYHIKNFPVKISQAPKPLKSKPNNHSLGTRALKRGVTGSDVFELKKSLITKGYKLQADYYFDDYFEVLVKDFQARHNIPADGIVAPLTVYYLKEK